MTSYGFLTCYLTNACHFLLFLGLQRSLFFAEEQNIFKTFFQINAFKGLKPFAHKGKFILKNPFFLPAV